jgi:hypothetical protein
MIVNNKIICSVKVIITLKMFEMLIMLYNILGFVLFSAEKFVVFFYDA